MANSKYEYVKSFETDDEIMFPNLIVAQIDGRDFKRFSEVHGFEKPNDERALNLMNKCAVFVMEEYPDIVFSYGFNDEYSFVFKSSTKFYQRRASKVLSLVVSFFTSVYSMNWKEFFPQMELKYPPSFHCRVTCCATVEVLQHYLAWRQYECHISNQYETCLWKLIKSGKTEIESHEFLKGTLKQQKNELLFQHFQTNYKNLPPMFRQGSCVLRRQMEELVKHKNGTPVKRIRTKPVVFHSENIAARSFWNEQPSLVKELGAFTANVSKIRKEFIRSFLFENKLMLSSWIVIRIDGCHFHSYFIFDFSPFIEALQNDVSLMVDLFKSLHEIIYCQALDNLHNYEATEHRFSEIHEFDKPNDKQALNLMNSCAVAILEEFPDVIFAYGVSDEYSFILRRDSKFYQRQASKIVSVVVSCFSAMYVMKWKDFFPQKELKYMPSFDGRAVCYPSSNILRDYLAWRQVDCHINNQYNTCFWELVKFGKSKSEAQNILKGTRTREKNELLEQQFGINYSMLLELFRHGSSVFRIKEMADENGASDERLPNVVVEHCNIIEPNFWDEHPSLLD